MTGQSIFDMELQDFILRTTSDGVLAADAEERIQYVNPAAAAMLGITRDELIGYDPRRAFRQNHALINLFTREGEQSLDVRLPRRRLAVGVGRTLETGQRVVVLSDVTEKRELEDRRETLIKAMSHDLRNPISALIGFSDLVEKFGELNDQQAKFLTRIRQTATKLHDVIGPLVDLAWIEAGMPLEHKPAQLRDIINQAVSDATSLAHRQKIVIAVSVQNPMPIVVGDTNRLCQVIFNLLENAILYSHPEQTVVIHGWGDSHEVYCSVADQGIGISDDELELVFDRLYRSTDERVRNIPGGGIGLTMAKTIILRHGGDIWASSNLDEGSTFTFVLPTVEI